MYNLHWKFVDSNVNSPLATGTTVDIPKRKYLHPVFIELLEKHKRCAFERGFDNQIWGDSIEEVSNVETILNDSGLDYMAFAASILCVERGEFSGQGVFFLSDHEFSCYKRLSAET
ncbi:MAG TPA: hypothetical protein VGK19_18335 [Capsulimonadaceae bacterium]|jgi:hypothetical protein